jgi:hypothetical protein
VFDVDAIAFAAMSEHFIDQLKAGEAHSAMPSMMKYAGTELNKKRHELIMAAGGSNALEWSRTAPRRQGRRANGCGPRPIRSKAAPATCSSVSSPRHPAAAGGIDHKSKPALVRL